jgi:tRNA (guanine37-N1)-methyltransferase
MFDCYINESILKRAQKRGLVKFKIVNIRDFATDKHRTVDDKPYGGGPGMIMKIEPIYKALKLIKKGRKSKIILLSAKGKTFGQKMAEKFSKCDHLIFICGRYEGVDERVAKYLADEEISIGNYVLTGGELPAMVIADTVTRLVPGVIKPESLKEETFKKVDLKEYPQYTRPEKFFGWKVPKTLLSGNHKKIEEWRRRHSHN